MMKPTGDELAAYFGVSRKLLPYLNQILADFAELGSDPDLVAAWLGEQGVGPEGRVLDLGCGKGAAALALSRTLGCRVAGIDAFEPFIVAARRRATELGVAHLCSFRVGDIRSEARTEKGYDGVMLLAVGSVFGGPDDTVDALRRCVHPGGLMVIDDAYLLGGSIDFPGYESLLTRADTLARLTSHGDEILAERLFSRAEVEAQNRRFQTWIEERGRILTERHSELAADVTAYINKERQECHIIERRVRNAVWLLRRSGRRT